MTALPLTGRQVTLEVLEGWGESLESRPWTEAKLTSAVDRTPHEENLLQGKAPPGLSWLC